MVRPPNVAGSRYIAGLVSKRAHKAAELETAQLDKGSLGPAYVTGVWLVRVI